MFSVIFEDTVVRVIATMSVAIIAVSWLIKKSRTPPLPPGPLGLPVLGNLLSIEPDFHRYCAKLSRVYGPIFKLKLGSKICIHISSPSLAKQILKDQDAIFANRDPPASALVTSYGLHDIVWMPNGPEWRQLRKVFVREMMSSLNLDDCALRRAEVREMVKEVYKKVGSPINLGEQMFLAILNVVMNMLWGSSLHGEERSSVGVEFRQVVGEIVEMLGKPNISDLFPTLAWLDLQGIESKTKKLVLWFDRIFDSVIVQRMKIDAAKGQISKQNEENKDFLHFLLELKQQGEDKTSLSMTQIKGLLLDTVLGGTDTTSTTLEWAMAEMLQHSEIMRKVQQELDEVVGNGSIVEESHIPKLHFLQSVVKETLRLHPPLPLLVPHCPVESCTVGGYTIPKGSRVFVNVWSMHRDPEAWQNPLEFHPERFLKELGKLEYQGTNFRYLPFGSGRRICAGISLAEKMVAYVLATLLHSF
ncbi:hypothetical protein CISIN_1g048742mg, partial [Citrus sinensis]